MKSEDISAHISIKTTFFKHSVIFVSNYIENQEVKKKSEYNEKLYQNPLHT